MKNKGKKLWKKSIKIIPGGNGLLSKRPYRFIPDYWPTYYKECKGIYVTDLNNKKYIDMSLMGVGTCSLGYSLKKIDNYVIKSIRKGVNCTLNSTNEYNLAKKILKYHKFASKVKFARGGGEAMDIAIRAARAKTNKDVIAFSGYHGWYDWYLSSNLSNKKNLDTYLLPNLKIAGVPKKLRGTTIPVNLNKKKDLIKLEKSNNIAAIVIELCRENYEDEKLVKKIEKICKNKKICLIVDEITTGWRGAIGGEYQKYKIKPDILVYGKALGNGYAISSIIGNSKYLDKINDSFASSTAWTEKVGFSAAEATIDFFVKNKVHKHINKIGLMVINGWTKIAKKYGVKIDIGNYRPIPNFKFLHEKNNKLATIFCYEMLKRGYLATNSIYLSYSHNKKQINRYLMNCDEVFKILKKFLKTKKSYSFLKEKSMV